MPKVQENPAVSAFEPTPVTRHQPTRRDVYQRQTRDAISKDGPQGPQDPRAAAAEETAGQARDARRENTQLLLLGQHGVLEPLLQSLVVEVRLLAEGGGPHEVPVPSR